MKKLRICLILQGGLYSHIAGLEYISNIIVALGNLPDEIRSIFEICLLAPDSALEPSFYQKIKDYVSKIYSYEHHIEKNTFANKIKWKAENILLKKQYPMYDRFFEQEKFDFVYPYFSLSPKKKYRSATLIYDFQHRYLTQFFTQEEIDSRTQLHQSISENLDLLILSSQDAQSDFNKFYPQAKCQTQVLPFKVNPLSSWFLENPIEFQKKYNLPDKFFILSNQFWQHKNHELVFKAIQLLQNDSIYPAIVCTGYLNDHRQPSYGNKILSMLHELGISDRIYLLGLIPKLDQIQLMRRSLAVIQPSLFEGWNTVIEEAKSLGKPLIVSDLSVHQEQNPPHSFFFKKNSVEDLAAQLALATNTLAEGPNLVEEKNAAINYASEVQDFAYRFLEIVKS